MKWLKGIRILDCSQLLPGPFATHYLAEMGAEVIKIEPLQGDPLRQIPSANGQKGLLFEIINRNKKSIALNLKHDEGREAFFRLLKDTDVLIEGFRPGVMETLNAGYEACREVKPDIIYVSLTGWGQSGPYASMAGHDLNYLGISGAGSLIVDRERRPIVPGMLAADISGSAHTVIAVLGSLIQRKHTGAGAYIDVSMLEGAMFWGTPFLSPALAAGTDIRPGKGTLLGEKVCNQIYETKDHQFVALAAIEPKFWTNFCTGLGKQEWIERHMEDANGEGFHNILIQTFAEKDCSDWAEFGARLDCCLFPILSSNQVWENEHILERQLIEEWNNQAGHKLKGMRLPFSANEDSAEMETRIHPAPSLGQDTKALLTKAGYAHSEIDKLLNGSIAKAACHAKCSCSKNNCC